MRREGQVAAFLRGLVWLAAAVVASVLWCQCAHAGACPDPPAFAVTGLDCTAQRQPLECGCTEWMSWDPVLADPETGAPAAEWYEIGRQDPGSQTLRIVGDTRWRNHEAYLRCKELVPATTPTVWHFAWDDPPPVDGELYLYRTRSCSVVDVAGIPQGVCSAWNSRSVDYRAAPYRTYP